jgi:replicative DNA helicase
MANKGKLPPQNTEAEQSVLGALLIDTEAIHKISHELLPDDFYKGAHQMIYEAMIDLTAKSEPIDIISVGNRLRVKKQLDQIGGQSYLSTLSNFVPTASHIKHYTDIIQKKAILRRMISATSELSQLAYDESTEANALLDKSEQLIFSISQKYTKHSFIGISTLLTTAFERIEAIHKSKGQLRGVSTGFTDLDNLLSGLQKSDLVVLAARPSVGKTALALDIAKNAAMNMGIPVGIFSLEMSKDQLIDRLICAEADVNLWKLRTGHLSTSGEFDDFSKINKALETLSNAPIYIDDVAITNILEIKSKARRLQLEKGLGLLVIDYLQLMEGLNGTENRVQEIAEITRALKGIARELNIPVLVLSQLSRAVEMHGGPAIPKLAHLRESGSIEQDADVVMFIYRKNADRYYANRDLTPEDKHIAEIHIAKHRNGPTGLVKLFWDDEKASFKNLSKDMATTEGSYEEVAF